MDKETLKENNTKIADALKVLNRALLKEEKAKQALNKAKAEVNSAKDNYALALDEAKKVVV